MRSLSCPVPECRDEISGDDFTLVELVGLVVAHVMKRHPVTLSTDHPEDFDAIAVSEDDWLVSCSCGDTLEVAGIGVARAKEIRALHKKLRHPQGPNRMEAER